MQAPMDAWFMRSDIGGGFNPAMLPLSRGIFSQGDAPAIQKRMDQILRGEFGGVDPQQVLLELNRDMLASLSRAQLSTGVPVREDLEAPATRIIPIDTPVRNKLPRTPGSSIAAKWYTESSLGGGYGVSTTVTSGTASATQTVGSTSGMQAGQSLFFAVTNAYRIVQSVTNSTTVVLTASITTTTAEAVTMGPYQQMGQNPIQVFFAEDGAPATAKATYTLFTEPYKLLGTIFNITGFAMAGGASFGNQLNMEKEASIWRLMLAEEFALIQGSSTIVAPPFGDGTNAYGFDGVLNLTTTANGTPGSHIQTSVGALTLAHLDAQVSRITNDGGRDLYMVVNSQEAQSMAHLATGTGAANRIVTTTANIVLGAQVVGYMHPVTGQLIPILVSRFMPAGTIWFASEKGPFGQTALDVHVLPQVQLPDLAPNVQIQGYTAQEIAPAITSPQVYPGITSVYEVPRMFNANIFGKSTGITPV